MTVLVTLHSSQWTQLCKTLIYASFENTKDKPRQRTEGTQERDGYLGMSTVTICTGIC